VQVLTIFRVIMKANNLDWLRAWSASAHDQGDSLSEVNKYWSATCVIPKRLTLIEFHDSTSLSWQGRNGWVDLRKFGCAMAEKEVRVMHAAAAFAQSPLRRRWMWIDASPVHGEFLVIVIERHAPLRLQVSCIYRLDPPSPAANRALKRCNIHVFERGTDGASAPGPDAVRRFFNVVQNARFVAPLASAMMQRSPLSLVLPEG
jgi:hypothetical protein